MDFILESYALDHPKEFSFVRGTSKEDEIIKQKEELEAWKKVLPENKWKEIMFNGVKPVIPDIYKKKKKV